MAEAAFPAVILETRKTAPGLRLVDKWAVYYVSPADHIVVDLSIYVVKLGVPSALRS